MRYSPVDKMAELGGNELAKYKSWEEAEKSDDVIRLFSCAYLANCDLTQS